MLDKNHSLESWHHSYQKVSIIMIARNLEASNITPITTSSNTVEWFAARKGSFTSYPTDRIINCVLRLSKSTRDILSIENDDINTYFRYLGKINNIVDEHTDTIQHSIFMLEINCNTDDGKKARFKLKSDVNNNKYNKDKLLNIVEYLTGESKNSFSKLTEDTVRSNLKDWCGEKCQYARRYSLKTISALKLEYTLRKNKPSSKSSASEPKNKNDLIKWLVTKDKKSKENKNKTFLDLFQMKVMNDIIISSYLKPINSQRSESKYMKLDHNNEKVLINNLLKDRDLIHALLGFDLHEIYEVGIVMNKNKIHMKTTAVFLAAMLTSTHGYALFLVECKTRCTSST